VVSFVMKSHVLASVLTAYSLHTSCSMIILGRNSRTMLPHHVRTPKERWRRHADHCLRTARLHPELASAD
jgi:hypothetical protein